MGLIDFVKNAGQSIFGKDEPEAPAAPTGGPSPEEVERMKNRRKAASLVQFVQGMGFEVDDLSVRVDGHTATISGKVDSQADREKIILAVGNTEGIAQVDDQLEVEVDEPEATYYTVQSGDSLSKIAKEHYGNAMKYPMIFEANKPLLSDPDKIYPGQVLRIPPLED
jgi:nucleoid-associated protein YgaU